MWIRKKLRRKNIKKQKNVIRPNEPKFSVADKVLDWLKHFFGVEQHRFDTLKVINMVKRPEQVMLTKIMSLPTCVNLHVHTGND